MKQDRIKRALHSFIDRMDYKLQRKAYYRDTGKYCKRKLPGDGLRVLCAEICGKRCIKHQGGSSRPASAVSSVGKSTRLITGRAWVRVPHGTLVARTATLQQ